MLRARPQVAGWRCRADSMNYDTILVTHHGPTAVVALNRPDKLNAMSMMLKAELVRALHDLDKHEETRTITLTGDGIDAAEAWRMGLVDEVVPHSRLEPRTFEIADRIGSRSALAVRLAKAAVRASARMPLNQGLRYEQTLFTLAMASEDKEEGVGAFLAKRDPKWKDR